MDKKQYSGHSTFSGGRRRFLAGTTASLAGVMIPRLATSSTSTPFTLTAAPSGAAFNSDLKVPVWAFNGAVPGPEIRVKQGEKISVRLNNRLDQSTSIHWHGIRINNAMDGVPNVTQNAVIPGGSFDYVFTAPDAGTYWYHSHASSSEQVGRGLYGPLVVEEETPYPVDRDITMVVDDWRINNLKEIDPSFGNMHDISHGGRLGNYITVNGVREPDIPVAKNERLRIRVINVSNARIMTLQLGGYQPWVIALDGQPVAPAKLEDGKITVAPGQRTDLVVDIIGDEGSRAPLNFIYDRGVIVIANFLSARSVKASILHEPPPMLTANPLSTTLDTESPLKVDLLMAGGAMGGMRGALYQGRELTIGELVNHGMVWALNGVSGLPPEPLFKARRGQTVLIDILNDNRWPHAMHVHGHHFRVIKGNGTDLSDSPWRDTTLVFGFDRSQIAFVADNPGKWLLHCHMLEHSVGGMMTWFEVT